MNKYLRGLIVIPTGLIKTLSLKIFHPKSFKGVQLAMISPFSEITITKGKLVVSKGFKMRDGAKIRVRKGAKLEIGRNCSLSSNDIITCHDSITIGNNLKLSPNVQIYDQDHDYNLERNSQKLTYKTSPIVIGNNVWIGANSVILRGSKIGDNVVIGAGSIVKGEIPSNTVFIQKRENILKEIN